MANISGTSGNDVLTGTSDADIMTGLGGNDSLSGLGGDDLLDGGAGNDTLDGGTIGAFYDNVAFSGATTGVVVDLAAGTAQDGQGGTDKLVNIGGVNDTSFNDIIRGDAKNNQFVLTGGDDSVDGGGGNDAVAYFNASAGVNVDLTTGKATGTSIGTDTLVSIEYVDGSFFADTVRLAAVTGGAYANGRGGNDYLIGSSVDDALAGGSGNDTLDGGAGNDTAAYDFETTFDNNSGITLTGQGVTVNLATGTAIDNWGTTDTLISIEYARGSPRNDMLIGGNAANAAFEGFQGMGGNDTMDGGAGIDRAAYDRSPAAVSVNLSTGVAQDGWGGTDKLLNMENVRGSEYNDTLTGDGNDNLLEGMGGNDLLDAGAGNDTMDGGAGNDTLMGGDGGDNLTGGAGDDSLQGGAQRLSVNNGADLSPQYDVAIFTAATSGMTIKLSTDGLSGSATGGGLGNDTLTDIEFVIGSGFADTIYGSNRALTEIFRGGLGDDVIYGGAGTGTDLGVNNIVDYRNASGSVTVNLASGTVSGADGNDTLNGINGVLGSASADLLTGANTDDYIEGGNGNDTLDGGGGSDRASYSLATAGVTVSLLTGTSSGAAGTDTLLSIENLRGSEFNDTLIGDDNANDFQARAGNDTISAGAGDDTLHGGYGDDSMDGGTGNDRLVYYANRANYTVTDLGNGRWTIKDNTGTDGNDTVTGVETVQFADMQLILQQPTSGPLAITAFSPANAAIGVAKSPTISITFSSAIALGTGTIYLRDADGKLLTTYTASSPEVSVSGGVLTLKPSALAGTSNYTVDLGAGIVKDLAGTAFAGSNGYHFTTVGNGQLIEGTAGPDTLVGGAGDDTLQGLAGDDKLDGAGGDDVLDGGSGNDSLAGGIGSDTLIGGTGADTMAGGDGADLYYVDDAGDLVQELASNAAQPLAPNAPAADLGRSVDKVIASINYTLTAFVENLSLAVGAGGIAAFGNELANVLTGNEGNNTLVGNAGDDTLDGAGGADTMSGGIGADTYYVDNADDVVTETATDALADKLDPRSPDLGRAVDKVVAGINYTLTSFVENLTLAPAAGNLAGSGNELNNELYGNEGNNTLNGKAGNDTLDGGAGTDTAQYSGKLAEYTVVAGANAGSITIADKTANRDGSDSLNSIERLKFADGSLALDMATTQAGGKAVLMMAVATSLGKDFVNLPSFAGLFLNFFDSGASLLDGATLLVSAGITAAFAGGADNASLVKMVYNDVYGQAPDAATLASLLAPLNAGTISQAQWLADMAASTANQQHVGLTGYAGTGLQYTV